MPQSPIDPQPQVTLSPDDAAALDAVLDPSGRDLSNDQDPNRTVRVEGWLKVLSAAPAGQPSSDLVDRTLAAVQVERMKLAPRAVENRKSKIENAPRRWPSRHLADVAAMLIAAGILVAVIIPAVGHARFAYRRTLCAANVSYLATAVDHYVNENAGQLPALATRDNANWLYPDAAGGGGHTNTANLLPLVLAQNAAPAYIAPKHLICPGRGLPDNAAPALTTSDIPDCDYSYINLFGKYRSTWDGKSTTIILADRNPLFSRASVTNPELNSPNHGRNGNYVLRADHSVTWEITPDIGPGRDNIWTIASTAGGGQRILVYSGTETPSSPNDVFLAP